MAISSDLERLLSAWLPRQPWYSRTPAEAASDPDVIPMSVTRLFEIETDDQVVQGLQVIAAVGTGAQSRRINIPLVLHTAENFRLRPHLIGRVEDLLLGMCWVYDGAADPIFVQAVAANLRAGHDWDDGQVRAHALGTTAGFGHLPAHTPTGEAAPTSQPVSPAPRAGSNPAGTSPAGAKAAQAAGIHHSNSESGGTNSTGTDLTGSNPAKTDPVSTGPVSTGAAGSNPRDTRADAGGEAATASPVEAVSVAPPPDPAQILRDAAAVEIELLGDQAERSTVVIRDPADPGVLTFFRVLRTGMAQNVQVPLALTKAGSPAVRPVLGWLAGRWFDGDELETMTAPLAMLTASERDAQPAWREAVDIACQVDSGLVGSYNRKANALGQRVGRLHLDLAAEFPTQDSAGDATRELVSKWQNRVDWALARAPLALSKLAKPLRTHKKRLGNLGSVGRLQRVHGDLTLNHVVSGRTSGFTIVDFPARQAPKDQPVELDLVALLRSIDYAAGYARLTRTGALSGDASPSAFGTKGLSAGSSAVRTIMESPEFLWSGQAQNALLSGYGHAVGKSQGLKDPVLRAVLVDRLLVETVAELHNRPTWLVVPLVSLIQLLS